MPLVAQEVRPALEAAYAEQADLQAAAARPVGPWYQTRKISTNLLKL
jgi:hypothetical protein